MPRVVLQWRTQKALVNCNILVCKIKLPGVVLPDDAECNYFTSDTYGDSQPAPPGIGINVMNSDTVATQYFLLV